MHRAGIQRKERRALPLAVAVARGAAYEIERWQPITRVEVVVIGRILLLGLPGVPVIRRPGPGVQSA